MRRSTEAIVFTTERLIERLFSQPTAPFREQFVLGEAQAIAHEASLPFCRDRFGNLIIGVKKLSDLARGQHLLLFAHTDHPDFFLWGSDI